VIIEKRTLGYDYVVS